LPHREPVQVRSALQEPVVEVVRLLAVRAGDAKRRATRRVEGMYIFKSNQGNEQTRWESTIQEAFRGLNEGRNIQVNFKAVVAILTSSALILKSPVSGCRVTS